MKKRVPILFLLLLAGGLVVWLLSAAHRTPRPAPRPYWAEQIEVLDELGRSKHVTAVEYEHFAAGAESEGVVGAAKLFHALARSEQVHEMNCADAVRRLGGHYIPPLKVIVLRGRTQKNLVRALEETRLRYDRFRTGDIERAMQAGNRYAARTLIRIAGGDMRQMELLNCYIEHPDSVGYAVCPGCGNLFCIDYCDIYCPVCQTAGTKFERYP